MQLTGQMELHQNLGDFLKLKRMDKGLTQGEVAQKLGYSTPQFISNIERGLCSPPLKNLKTLIKLYGIHHEEVIELILQEQEKILRKALSQLVKPQVSRKKRIYS